VGTLSGGERQCVAIARAVFFGASVLILDEPTSALGVREAALVLRLVRETRERGLAVLFITHNVGHAEAIGDRFIVLNRGTELARCRRGEVGRRSSRTSWPEAPRWMTCSTPRSSDRRMRCRASEV
jgi:simple sugar transport system ATP-binding protein